MPIQPRLRYIYIVEEVITYMAKDSKINPNRMGIYADNLMLILTALKKNKELDKMYDGKVFGNIVIVADDNNLRIEDGGQKKLTKAEAKNFEKVLKKAIQDAV